LEAVIESASIYALALLTNVPIANDPVLATFLQAAVSHSILIQTTVSSSAIYYTVICTEPELFDLQGIAPTLIILRMMLNRQGVESSVAVSAFTSGGGDDKTTSDGSGASSTVGGKIVFAPVQSLDDARTITKPDDEAGVPMDSSRDSNLRA
jgi:hypothetical protein